MAQIRPTLGASARMTWKVVSFPLIAGLLLLKPIVDTVCGFVLIFDLVAAIASSFPLFREAIIPALAEQAWQRSGRRRTAGDFLVRRRSFIRPRRELR